MRSKPTPKRSMSLSVRMASKLCCSRILRASNESVASVTSYAKLVRALFAALRIVGSSSTKRILNFSIEFSAKLSYKKLWVRPREDSNPRPIP